ncbi:MAG: bifunctional acetate--CoA ligase family protein/GNAT family N-acetyltransferase [Pirellulaceae bacterium]|nr:bifunctional acetate--CoA ligase family protein/GNAT family N-acetyltransferase [Pirellulaceae bacterium]
MSVLNLEHLLAPNSVALIGASNREGKLGFVVLQNLLQAGFRGPIWPVNPKYPSIGSQQCWPSIAAMPAAPELAIIATPAPTIPTLIRELGEIGTRAAVVLSAGTQQPFTAVGTISQGCSGQVDAEFSENLNQTEQTTTIDQMILRAARPFGLRILGPNCVGLIVPHLGLNASFAHTDSLLGRLALISQSGALCTTLLDWARSRGIGFSHFVSLGNALDVDFGDLLNYLSNDQKTNGILLYIESIDEARKFMSAARAASRNKPVVVLKAGRFTEGARAAFSHTGALIGNDDVFDSAIRRAGMVRVNSIEALLAATETLARARPIAGNRFAILTNGGGPGVLATDALISRGGKLAELEASTIEALDRILPANWSKTNPVDIIGDADSERYVAALRILLNDSNCDAIMVMLVPVAVIDNQSVARSVVTEIKHTHTPILTCWLGADSVNGARRHFEQQEVPTYETPEAAIEAFMLMVDYQANQQALMQTPPSVPAEFSCDQGRVRQILSGVLGECRQALTEAEVNEVLKAYHVPVVETKVAATVEEAVELADQTGFPVALKILSPDITHKSDVGGVQLNIGSRSQLMETAQAMRNRIQRLHPTAHLAGFTVQPMVHRPQAQELIVGSMTDRVFGPTLLFGQGGKAVEVVNDKSVALPPLNLVLAADLIRRTRVYRSLQGYRDVPAANLEAIQLVVLKISQLICDFPEIEELDINPLLADSSGVVALDARIRVGPADKAEDRLAIRPYPSQEEQWITLSEGKQALLRPIRPEDEAAHHDFLDRLTAEDRYFRFFRAVADLDHSTLARFTQIDYDREMAFIAVGTNELGKPETWGVARAVSDADHREAEFAIVVRSDLHSHGIGHQLLNKLLGHCKQRGIQRIVGQTMSNNHAMLELARSFGFQILRTDDRKILKFQLDLA